MAEKLTDAQRAVVYDRGGKLLVSAAAGSGKTKVLVDRLLLYLCDPVKPANIDDFLIITFTKAAASELRGKIAEKLSERIAEDPNNVHLQRQIQRLYLAKISTVHSFCSDILREYAYRLDISADFRVAEKIECDRFKSKVLERVLNEAYENLHADTDLQAFIESQGLNRNDDSIPGIIKKVYENSCCHKDPEQWLEECLKACTLEGITDPAQTDWGEYIIDQFHAALGYEISAMEKAISLADKTSEFDAASEIMRNELLQIKSLAACDLWQKILDHPPVQWAAKIIFPRKTSYVQEKERIMLIRNRCKDTVKSLLAEFVNDATRELSDLEASCAATRGLLGLVDKFAKGYEALKKAHHVVDYNDLEHGMLDLLLGKQRTGPTTVARELSMRFREIMVDEYQDTNEVQDTIFSVLCAERNNCFMVGDVKQSIYQFRLADPTIFLEKYNTYTHAEKAAEGQPRKILLSANFRSASQVVGAVNDVFTLCMSPRVGGLYYGDEERLVEGIPHSPANEPEIEFYALKTGANAYADEAEFIAERVSQLLDGKHTVREKDNKVRTLCEDDIVILLRSVKTNGGIIMDALQRRGIRCAMEKSGDILQYEEVQTLYSILQAINNPLQDIPLAATMVSRVFGFTADEIARIRAPHKKVELYFALERSDLPKAKAFMEVLTQLRRHARACSVSELVDQLFAVTSMDSIYSAMPDGQQRLSNLQTFCAYINQYCASSGRDLGQFVDHIRSLPKGLELESDSKPSGTVMIYTIHKSKGLEFPVVILGCMARDFSTEEHKQQVLCHKNLGLGMYMVNNEKRVRYPTLARKAILKKQDEEQLSEEMRILYVAMTRAKDRIIMTYAYRFMPTTIRQYVELMDIYPSEMIVSDASCPGDWILYTALHRTEAGELFAQGGKPDCSAVSDQPWLIKFVETSEASAICEPRDQENTVTGISKDILVDMKKCLSFQYPHKLATQIPSKQTATQLKGRTKDMEAAENTAQKIRHRKFRRPSFVGKEDSGVFYGNAIHSVMQYIDFTVCENLSGVKQELDRLVNQGYIDREQAEKVNCDHITAFFATDLGKQLMTAKQVLREFKFSVLEDADAYFDGAFDETILMQGVVDCAMIEDDGITVLDFKSDHVTEETLDQVALGYRPQVRAYASAISRIYEKPVKRVCLYFFRANTIVDID